VVMMIFRPEGLLPEPRRKMELHDENAPGQTPITPIEAIGGD
jgi:hypothetical protein